MTLTDDDKTMIQKWVAELESGRWKQGRDYLRSGNEYCCLGVFAKACLGRGVDAMGPQQTLDDLHARPEWMTRGQMLSLSDMNDTGSPFAAIAQSIRSMWPEAFA